MMQVLVISILRLVLLIFRVVSTVYTRVAGSMLTHLARSISVLMIIMAQG